MKTFTKIFALLFAFTIISSMSMNAQWYTETVNGDASAPLMEIWVYGATVGVTQLADGDIIGAFDGPTLVGIMTVDVEAPATQIDETNWINNRLMVYSKDANGDTLYVPGRPITFKAYNGAEYYAFDWGDGQEIDFHNTWFATHGDQSSFANEGAFFPSAGASGYCYVDLKFNATPATPGHTINFNVFNADGSARLNDVYISSGGYQDITDNSVHSTNDGEAQIVVFYNGTGTIDFTFVLAGLLTYATEIVTVSVSANTGTTTVPDIYLNAVGSLTGTITLNPVGGGNEPAHGAIVSTTIGGVIYSDATDATGLYTITNIPDGSWDFTISHYGYDSEIYNKTITNGAPTTLTEDLDPYTGTLEGEFFNATNLQLITAIPTFALDGVDLVGGAVTINNDGTYDLVYTAGTYDLTITFGGFEVYLIEDFVINPSVTVTENFNFMPSGDPNYPYFDAVTGNPNQLWSIHLEVARFGNNPMLPYDELAIFDDNGTTTVADDIMVGSISLIKPVASTTSGYNVLKAFGQFSNGDPGFTQGNDFYFMAYDVSHGNGDTTGVPVSWNFNQYLGTYHGTTFPDPAGNHVSYLNIFWDFPDGSIIGTVYEDDGGVGVTPANALDGATVEILNIFTQEVIGTTTTNADGTFAIELDEGTYDVKLKMDGYATDTVGDVVVVRGEVTDIGDRELLLRPQFNQTYSFDGPGFFFFGRCVEIDVLNDDMTDIYDNNSGNTVGPGIDFSDEYQNSWIENDASPATQMTYAAGGNWINEFDWELKEGYLLFVHPTDDTDHGTYSFNVDGIETNNYLVEPEDNPITLASAGIHYVPYFPHTYASPDNALSAFATILDSIDWVMNSAGDRLHKDNGGWIDNIGTMNPLEGYKVKTTNNAALTLTYPAETSKSYDGRVMLDAVHFVYNEGNAADWTYTININTDDFEIGDEIAAYSNGHMVGSMVIDSEEAWENDLNMFYKAVNGGYEFGTDIELLSWDASNGNEYNVEFEMVAINADAYIGTKYPAGLDHFSYVNVYRGTVSVDENQIDNNVRVYPNPTSGTLNIESVSNIKELHVYSIYGSLVSVVKVNAKQQSVDVSNYATGTYMVQLHTDTGVITKRVIIK